MAGFIRDDAVAMVRQFLEMVHLVGEQTGIDVQAAVSGLQAFLLGDNPTSEVIAQYVVAIIRNMHSPEVLHDFTRPAIPDYQTPSRNKQRSNSAAFVQLVQTCAIARSARITADLRSSPRYSAESTSLRDTKALITRDEMQKLRVKVTMLVTDQLIELSDLSLFPTTQAALVALRTNAVRHMTAQGEHLARTFGTTCCDGLNWHNYMPALALAYRHYGVLNDDVIIERNEIPNPLFIEPNAYVELMHEVTF
jgi:prophage DNA circulation protein